MITRIGLGARQIVVTKELYQFDFKLFGLYAIALYKFVNNNLRVLRGIYVWGLRGEALIVENGRYA